MRSDGGPARAPYADPPMYVAIDRSAATNRLGSLGRPARGNAGSRRGLGGLGARNRAVLHREATLESAVDLLFDESRALARHLGDLRDDEEFRAVQHPLLAEGQVLRPCEERQALEHFDNVIDGAGAHPVRVVLEAAFPVLVIVDFAVAEEVEEPVDFFVVDRSPQTNVIDVVYRNEDRCFVRHHPQMVKTAGRPQNCFGFDALNDAESVVWVNDLVTDLKCHVSPAK